MADLELINSDGAPKALGNYSHAVRFGELIYVSGVASRHPTKNTIPGLTLDANGKKLSYDIKAETRATLESIRAILETAGSGLDRIVEVNVYLTDMKDFAAYNAIYAEFFPSHRPARTTIGVAALPGDISIEMKAVAVKR